MHLALISDRLVTNMRINVLTITYCLYVTINFKKGGE